MCVSLPPVAHLPDPSGLVSGAQEQSRDMTPQLAFVANATASRDACDVPKSPEPEADANVPPHAPGPTANLNSFSFKTIFYPKKIPNVIFNFLTAETLNRDMFAKWWSESPLQKDFGLETTTSLIRAHVIPRKMLFDPSKWITSQEDAKEKLMRALGPVRSTQAIACQSLRSLHALHDDWIATQSDGHVVLWVGRTIFPRATPEHRFRGPDTRAPHGFNSEDALANDESGIASRSYPPGMHRSPLMECRRVSSSLHRTLEGQPRCESYAQGTWLHESCATQGAVCEARGGCSGEGGERTTPTTPSPNPLPTRRGGGELWPPCRQTSYLKWTMAEVKANQGNSSHDLIQARRMPSRS